MSVSRLRAISRKLVTGNSLNAARNEDFADVCHLAIWEATSNHRPWSFLFCNHHQDPLGPSDFLIKSTLFRILTLSKLPSSLFPTLTPLFPPITPCTVTSSLQLGHASKFRQNCCVITQIPHCHLPRHRPP